MNTLAITLLLVLPLSPALLGCSSPAPQAPKLSIPSREVDPPPPDILPFKVEFRPDVDPAYLTIDLSIVHVNKEFLDATIDSLALKLVVEDMGSYVEYSDPLNITGADLTTLKAALEPGHPFQHHVIHAKFKLKKTKVWDKRIVLAWNCQYTPMPMSYKGVDRLIGIYDPALGN